MAFDSLSFTSALPPPQDGELSVEEVLEEFDLFMDSQITDFGHAHVGHDEL